MRISFVGLRLGRVQAVSRKDGRGRQRRTWRCANGGRNTRRDGAVEKLRGGKRERFYRSVVGRVFRGRV